MRLRGARPDSRGVAAVVVVVVVVVVGGDDGVEG